MPAIFTDYSFLNNLVDYNNCTTEKITVYMSSGYPYVYVETPTSSVLYNGGGATYCTSGPGFNCLEFYQVDEVLATWSCSGTVVLPVDNDNDGVLSDIDLDDANPCVPNAVGPNCITCLLYTSPSPRDLSTSRMPSSA